MHAPNLMPLDPPPRAVMAMLSGVEFDLFRPLAEDVRIEDIAAGLARTPRFRGQTKGRHADSVAQHSVEVSLHVPHRDALWGLLHDAAEPYLADVPRPIRPSVFVNLPTPGGSDLLISYAAFEIRLLRIVAGRFGLSLPIPATVIEADDRCLATEVRDLFDRGKYPTAFGPVTAAPFAATVAAWSPDAAERAFLARFRLLRGPTP